MYCVSVLMQTIQKNSSYITSICDTGLRWVSVSLQVFLCKSQTTQNPLSAVQTRFVFEKQSFYQQPSSYISGGTIGYLGLLEDQEIWVVSVM